MPSRSLLALLALLAACTDADKDGTDTQSPDDTGLRDEDGDGFYGDEDCDDQNALVNPSADEICDSLDNDCDQEVDEDVTLTWYADADGDGYGDADNATEACERPDDHVPTATDCNDSSTDVYPNAPELCDDLDNDCDELVDEDVEDTYYADADGDGFGDPDVPIESCGVPDGYVDDDTDCDDADLTSYPDADELCDGADNDCDGELDEGTGTGVNWYEDRDEDGFGDPDRVLVACAAPDGYTGEGTDCDDLSSSNYPGADELCDGEDNDCDSSVDEDDAIDPGTWYADADSDGYGDPTATVAACDAPTGYLSDDSDCDDTDPSINPDATETCDGVDQDCNGAIDDGVSDASTWYADADSDGYGDPDSTVSACDAPAGYLADDSDCDDADDAINPDATETCDGEDDDCDGTVDEDDASDAATWYEDRDEDSYGDASRTKAACSEPIGYVSDDTDCDDLSPSTYPGADEYCDGEDDDCDEVVDEDDAVDAGTWYADGDGDDFGDATVSTAACSAPSGYVGDDTDCDDDDSENYPGAPELCDGEDDDCDGEIDEDSAVDAGSWYADTDGDDYGDPLVSEVACEAPTGYVASDEDCDDTDADVHPSADEYCDGEDDDCDGKVDEDSAVDVATWYSDRDEDGYGDPARTDLACDEPVGYVSDNTDCNDLAATIYPGADEICNSKDDDCDGTKDESAVDATTWYRDSDSDSYGDPTVSDIECTKPTGYVSDNTDCNDTTSSANPGQTEVCDGIDNDCDSSIDESGAYGETDWYADDDSDGYGDETDTPTRACDAATGEVADGTDCDDSDYTVNPGATEYCDGADDNCDGTEDGAVTWTTTTGSKTDYSSSFATGTSSSPKSVSFSSSGSLKVCDGTYYVNITASGTSFSIYGYNGSGAAVLNGAGKGRTLYTTSTTVVLDGVTFQNGYTTANGANVYLYNASSTATKTATLTDVILEDGSALRGGNLGTYYFTTDLTDVYIQSGDASSQGGGIYNYRSTITGDSVLIDSNTAEYGGGYYGATGTLDLTDSVISSNTAATSGGGLYLNNGDATFDNTDAEDNDGGDYGGGAYLSAADLTIDASEIDGNSSDVVGGGVYLTGAATFDCTGASGTVAGVWGNTSLAAGGAYIATTTATIKSTKCDWTASQDNDLYDIITSVFAIYSYGDNVTFTCSSGICS